MNAGRTAPSPSDLAWRKSSYSGSHGGDCVEVATSPLSWVKSSHSGTNGGDCVEVAASQVRLHVRDSKQPELGMLTLSRNDWTALLTSVV